MVKKVVYIGTGPDAYNDSIAKATTKYKKRLEKCAKWQPQLIDLVRGHSKIEEKESNGLRVRKIEYRVNHSYAGGWRCPFVYFDNDDFETVSLDECIHAHRDRPMHNRRRRRKGENERYRNEIQDQIDVVKQRDRNCEMCARCNDLQVDHREPSFAVLVEQYKKSNSSDWSEFHKEHAVLRVLCGTCHRDQAWKVPKTTIQAKRIRNS
jgi:hypothetical protein